MAKKKVDTFEKEVILVNYQDANTFLTNLDKDVLVHLENRYFLKRYTFSPGNWINEKGKKITEKVYSFILMHGKKWDNGTHLNFKESELGTVMDRYKEVLTKVKAERKELLTSERAERKLYPRLTNVRFNNVLISAIERMRYYNKYPGVGEKAITIYANGMEFRGRHGMTYPKDHAVTTEWIMDMISNSYPARYNVTNQTDFIANGTFVDKKEEVVNKDFVPYHFYIGYMVKVRGAEFPVYDSYHGGFRELSGKQLDVTLDELMNLEVVGEIQGINALPALMNKIKYCE